MGIVELFQWQWSGYSDAHQNRTNLPIQLLAVPAFIVSAACVAVAIAKLSAVATLLSVAAMLVCVALQVRGHQLEQSQPRPFKSRFDFVRRVLAEQFFTFARLVLTRRWYKNFAAKRRGTLGPEWWPGVRASGFSPAGVGGSSVACPRQRANYFRPQRQMALHD